MLIVDHRELVKIATESLILESGAVWEVVFSPSLDEAAVILQRTDISLVLLGSDDIASPISALTTLLRTGSGTPVALLTAEMTMDTLEQAFRAGASGILPLSLPGNELIQGIAELLGGHWFVPRRLLRRYLEKTLLDSDVPDTGVASTAGINATAKAVAFDAVRVSAREKDILTLLVGGSSNKEIARNLGISAGTVKNYVAALLQRFGVSSRTKLLPALRSHHSGIFEKLAGRPVPLPPPA